MEITLIDTWCDKILINKTLVTILERSCRYCRLNNVYSRVLGQLPPRKIAPNPKTNPNPNPDSNRWAIFLGGNCLVVPRP